MRIESSVSASAVVPDLVNGAVAEVRVVSQEVQVRGFPGRQAGRVVPLSCGNSRVRGA